MSEGIVNFRSSVVRDAGMVTVKAPIHWILGDRKGHGLMHWHSGRQKIWPRKSSRATVGFVGVVGPISLILHLEHLMLKLEGHDMSHNFVLEPLNIKERFVRGNEGRERSAGLRALRVSYDHAFCVDLVRVMQDAESSSAGLKIVLRCCDEIVTQRRFLNGDMNFELDGHLAIFYCVPGPEKLRSFADFFFDPNLSILNFKRPPVRISDRRIEIFDERCHPDLHG